MTTAIIVDDEAVNIEILKALLQDSCKEISIMGEATNIDKAEQLIKQENPAIVFLDVEMPNGNGFELLDRFHNIDFETIFITAHNDYSLRAIKYSALDYLLKPVNIDELKIAVQKAIKKRDGSQLKQQITLLLENLQSKNASLQKIAVPTQQGFDFITTEQIILCEASGNYTIFYTTDNQKVVSSKNIKDYEDILPANLFFRVHYSYIININRVKRYYKGRGGYVIMDNDAKIEVAQRRREEFLALLSHK